MRAVEILVVAALALGVAVTIAKTVATYDASIFDRLNANLERVLK